MNFSAWAIRNPIAPILGFVLLLLLGWQSYNRLPITRMPNIDVPLVSITVVQAGSGPKELETQITKDIEDAVAAVNGVKNVTSTVNDGVSTTLVEFRMEIATEQAVQDSKDAIDQILSDLPPEAESPIVAKVDVEGQAIQTFSISSPGMTIEELSWFTDDQLTRALQGRPGIGRVSRYGGVDREIVISLDPAKLGSYGITALAVSQQLALTNADIGAGMARLGEAEQAIRTLGNQATVEALSKATIALPSGRHVRLADLGQVEDSFTEPKSFGRKNGQPTVLLAIYRAKGASEVTAALSAETALDAIRAAYPEVEIELLDDQVYYTEGNFEAALHTLIEGAILAVLVVLIFLRNWRATLIAATALPLSAIPTFLVMDLLGFSLNLVSFLALTLATGILVDDAIVEIENIARHIKMGKSPYRAAIEAADEIGLAVIATTMTIVAVFVPVSFMPGIAGQYFRQFGATVAVSVLFSLLVARLITPMMAAYLMRSKDAHHEGGRDGFIMRGYLWIVRHTTATPKLFGRITFPAYYLTILAAIFVVMISVSAMMRIPGNLFPTDDEGRFAISVELPPGSSLDDTDRVTEAMRQKLGSVPEIAAIMTVGGSSPLGDREVRRANIVVLLERRDVSLERKLMDLWERVPVLGEWFTLPPREGRIHTQQEIEYLVFDALAEVPDIIAFKLSGPGATSRPFTFDVLSSNSEDLAKALAMLEAAAAQSPYLSNVAIQGNLPRPEIQITPRLDEAARLGVSTAAIAATLRVATMGDQDAALAKMSIDDRLIPVRVQLLQTARRDLDQIRALKVQTASGALVPLASVADISLAQAPAQIKRLNRQRVASIGADVVEGYVLDQATADFLERVNGNPEKGITGLTLPDSVTLRPSGDAEAIAELNTSFVNAMLLGLLLVLTVLILLFKSVIQPFTILLSLPLAIGGVAVGLLITQNPISMPVMIGLLMLMGIVTKNAILLIDFAIEMRQRGMDRFSAIVEAGHKRARPIVMTSIAMSAGMLPSALGVGEGGTFRAPMAIAVIGGIVMSTVLSLVIVPAFFLALDDLARGLNWLFARFIGKKEPEPEAPDAAELARRLRKSQEDLALMNARLLRLEGGARPGGGG